jgi:hypothetical protein
VLLNAAWPRAMLSTLVPAETIVETCISASRRSVSCASQAARSVPWIASGGADDGLTELDRAVA